MQWLQIPASYEVWFTGFKLYLERHSGSKAELARYLEKSLSIKSNAAQVKVSKLLARQHVPSAETFLDIAAWLQRKLDAKGEPPVFMPLAPPPTAKDPPTPNWREGGPAKFTTRVAESPP